MNGIEALAYILLAFAIPVIGVALIWAYTLHRKNKNRMEK